MNMPEKREKVVVAMSGGVDSSVAACLLMEQGYEVVGLFMRTGAKDPDPVSEFDAGGSSLPVINGEVSEAGSATCKSPDVPHDRHRGCCSANDAADARFVAGMLSVPFYVLNFEKDFDKLIDYFADEYAKGRTPNPCIVCNDTMKFGRIVEYADAVGAQYIATGHYARIGSGEHGNVLMRGVDHQKDQSYVLFGLERNILDRLMFPIGHLSKPEVREIADRLDLPNRNKPDSVEICFVPDDNYARVVKERRPEAFAAGNVVNEKGDVIGEHKGIGQYTVGQRRGLGIAAGEPIYVTQLNVKTNTVHMGPNESLLHNELLADRTNFLMDLPEHPFRADAKIRYLHKAAPATVTPLANGKVRVLFDEPQRAITPGQAVVFYDGDVVLGGAWIASSSNSIEKAEVPVGSA